MTYQELIDRANELESEYDDCPDGLPMNHPKYQEAQRKYQLSVSLRQRAARMLEGGR